MIRMGRSNKPETSPENPAYQENSSVSNNLYGARADAAPASNRGAMSESESIARDIKEGRLSGFVGSGTVLTGETTFQAMLRVDGHLTGRVTSENGTLIVGAGGRVDANVLVAAATIHGTVNGDVITMEKLELGRTARVLGNVQTPRLLIEDGAILEGSCAMLKAKEELEKRIAEAKMPSTSEISSLDDSDDDFDEFDDSPVEMSEVATIEMSEVATN